MCIAHSVCINWINMHAFKLVKMRLNAFEITCMVEKCFLFSYRKSDHTHTPPILHHIKHPLNTKKKKRRRREEEGLEEKKEWRRNEVASAFIPKIRIIVNSRFQVRVRKRVRGLAEFSCWISMVQSTSNLLTFLCWISMVPSTSNLLIFSWLFIFVQR